MAQFDAHRLKGSGELVLDCQSDLLSDLDTRFVVPLIAVQDLQAATDRLNPQFIIDNQQHVLATQLAGAVQRNELGATVASVRERSFEVIAALDMLISGV
jgi:toxin CcdB